MRETLAKSLANAIRLIHPLKNKAQHWSERLRKPLRTLAATALFLPTAALAAPYIWTEVTLPADSGAACGDGSPYKFFVNTNPLSSNTVVVFEGGGACWQQAACIGKNGLLGASNPNGISDSYMYTGGGLMGQITPLISRINLLGTTTKTQSWNMVFLPYCTGDVHTGNKIAVYSDYDAANPRVEYHRGYRNASAAAQWLAQNLTSPAQLLITGYSAGGAGATANYITLRNALKPWWSSALLNDSGMLYPAVRGGSIAQYPSLPLQTRIRDAWGLDLPDGIITQIMNQYPGQMDINNVGSLTLSLGRIFPNDRIGTATFQEDGIYSAFSYTAFYPDIAAATGSTQAALLNRLWRQDLANFTAYMNEAPANVGYYIPYGRPLLKSHTLTTLTFDDTGIADLNKASVNDFINDLTDPYATSWSFWNGWSTRPVQRSWQQTQTMPPDTILMAVISLAEQLFGLS